MKLIITLFAGLMMGVACIAQDMHGFEMRDGRYVWTGTFTSKGRDVENLKEELLNSLSASPYIQQVRATNDGRVVGSIQGLPEAISSTGMFVFSFGFTINCIDEEYTVVTKDWVGKSTNPAISGGVLRLEELLHGVLVGNKRRENFFKSHEEAQIDIFRLQ